MKRTLPQRPTIQVSLSSDEVEDLARELAIDRQVRLFPQKQSEMVREFITNLWEDGNGPTDEKQRLDYRRDANVVLTYLASLQQKHRKRKSKKHRSQSRSVAPAVSSQNSTELPPTPMPDMVTTILPAIL